MKTPAHLSQHIGPQAESRRFARIRNRLHSCMGSHPKRTSTALATLSSPPSVASCTASIGTLSPSAETSRPTQSA